jgi:hypothetical protein
MPSRASKGEITLPRNQTAGIKKLPTMGTDVTPRTPLHETVISTFEVQNQVDIHDLIKNLLKYETSQNAASN